MNRVLACDLDGVIFKFNDAYAQLFKQKFNLNFPPESDSYPPVWDWEFPLATADQVKAVWRHIRAQDSYEFWRLLHHYPGAQEFLDRAHTEFDAIYFITARSGKGAQDASVEALEMLGVKDPKVIIAHNKVPVLLEIGATDFLDDRDKNFEDILHFNVVERSQQDCPPDTMDAKLWMLDRPWNRHFQHPLVTRVKKHHEIF